MLSSRRLRAYMYITLAAVVLLLFFTSHARHDRDTELASIRDFYTKTRNAMDRAHDTPSAQQPFTHDTDADGDIDEDDLRLEKEMAERLRQAEKIAKDNANAKSPHKPDAPEDVIGVGSSAKGQDPGTKENKPAKLDGEDERLVEMELDSILKKSPIIIFSKSYCPYSKRAKGILLEKYVIEPAPYVVELDLHPLGPKIQSRLAEMTGRKTVPNIMIYGQSIGGGDEIAALDKEKSLADKITSLGKDRINVSERFVGSLPNAS